MTRSICNYLRWWIADYKGTTLVVTGPLFLVAGPIAMIAAAIAGDVDGLLVSVAILLLGLLIVFAPLLRRRGEAKPWNQPH